jgi:formate dehydrogenase maturation protein FdhE
MAADEVLRQAEPMTLEINGTCPSCRSGDLISITMTVAGRELAFSTCHLCEAKWWYRDGKVVPLQSVIGLVVQQ